MTSEPADFEIRVGIASGLVVAGDLIGTGEAQERGVIGETPNLAARLQTLAQPNTLLIDDSTRRLVGDLFEYRDLGAREVRGLPTKVPVWQVLRISAIDSRFEALRTSDLTPLVGRSRELELLLTRWEQAKVGEGQVVLLTGEAGIGKSRITVAFEERMRGERQFRLRYFCSLHHRDSSLYPFISHIERAAGFTRDDSGEEKLNKLEALLLQTQQRLDEVVPLFADLLALPIGSRYRPSTLDPRRRREMIFATLIDQLEALTQQRPVQLIVEDAHWMNSTSLELMQIVVERLTRWPVLLVMTFRPEFEPSWIGQAHVSTLTLSRLGLREAAAMVEEVAGGRALPHEIVDSVIERTDGIPLFIEELTKTLIEGDLLRTQDGRYVLTDRLPPQVDSIEPARLVDGAARSAQFGEGCRADRRRDRARIFVRTAEIGCHYSGQPVARCPGPANRCRFGVPSGRPAASGLHLQARACSGRCLQYPAAWPTPGAPCQNWQDTGDAVS